MADENHDGVDGLGFEIIYGEDGVVGRAGCAAAAECPDCGGTGNVPLLVTAQPCQTFGGTGKAGRGDAVVCEWVDGGSTAVDSPDADGTP